MLERFKLGQIVNAVGLKGESKVYPYTDYKERFEELDRLYIEDKVCEIERVRYQGNLAIVKFKGVDDRNAAEALKGKYLYIDRENARELEEDEYFVPDLVGLKVCSPEGEVYGTLKDVIQNTAQDVFEVVTDEGKQVLIPSVPAFVLDINEETGRITFHLIEGML